MPQYEVRVKKIVVSHCWVTINAKDADSAEKRAVAMGSSLTDTKDFSLPEPAKYEVDECLQVKSGQIPNGET